VEVDSGRAVMWRGRPLNVLALAACLSTMFQSGGCFLAAAPPSAPLSMRLHGAARRCVRPRLSMYATVARPNPCEPRRGVPCRQLSWPVRILHADEPDRIRLGSKQRFPWAGWPP